MKKNKIFCKGLLCDKWNRKVKCSGCAKYVCSLCKIKSMENKRIYCPNCYLGTFSPDWDKMNKEFEEMIKTLFPKKKKIPTVIKVKA